MYRILYNDSTIFDPYGNENEVVTDASMSVEINAAAYMDFTMSRLHPLYNTIAERDGVVTLYWDSNILFQGVIESIDIDIQGNKAISCVSALDYLNDTVVRPYSTIAGEQKLTAPSSVDGYFKWLIDQHNEHVLDSGKRFDVGVNQGANLQQNNFIYRSSTNNTTTASEISDQLLDSLGGYLTMRYVDDRYVLDLYADLHTMNTQIVDFGVNITDFSKTIDTKDQYTALILKGGSPEFQGGDFESGDWSHWVTHPNEPLVRDKTHGGDVSSYFVSGAGEYVNDSFFYFRSGRRYKATVYVKNERGSNVTIHGDYQYEQSGTWTTVNVGTSLTVENKGDQWTEFSFDFQPNLSEYTKIRPRWYFDNVTNDGNRRVYLDDFSFSQVSGDTDVAEDPISVSMIPDGGTQYDSNILKTGDVIYDPSSVSRYGYKEKVHEDSTITDADDLLQAGIKELNKLKDPQIGLNIKAVDLALFMEGYTHLNVGDAVRVRSAIHDTDEFLMVNSITLDLQDPGQSEYVIGKAYDSLTGQQSGFLRSLNSGINSSLDAVASLDQTTKDQAIQIGNVEHVANDASEKADNAQNTANNAQNTANSNKEAIDSIKDAQTEYEKQLEQMQQGVADATEEIGQVNERIEGMNSEIESAKSDIDSLRSSTETELQNVKQSVSKVQSDVDAVTQKASDLASDLDGTKATVEQVTTDLGEVKTTVSNAATKADQSLQVSTQASQTATQAQTTATSAYQDAQSALTQSSIASQTANAVKTELETKYSTTDEIAEQYATKSLVEQTSQSITSTVEATYATKDTVEALENIANNAVQTWMGSGAPTLSNKPASDWNTAELKSQHSGDIYYDTNTGYSYRFGSSDGSRYSWSLIKDTDISKAVADAAKAQQTAEGVSDEVTQLKTDIPATYATKTEVKQTTDSIKSSVSEVATTANSALSKATTVEQTANGLQTTVTEQAKKLDGAVTTISQVSQRVDSVSSTITQVQGDIDRIDANSQNFISNPQFKSGNVDGVENTNMNATDSNPGVLPGTATTFGKNFSGHDNRANNVRIKFVKNHTYRIEIDARIASDDAYTGTEGLGLFFWFMTADNPGLSKNQYTNYSNLIPAGTKEWAHASYDYTPTMGDNDPRIIFRPAYRVAPSSRWLVTNFTCTDVTAIAEAQKDADKANSTANSALSQSSRVEQSLNSFKTSVQQTYETKNDALSKQSSLQQSVNNLRTEVSETYLTKTSAQQTYSTKSYVDQTARTVSLGVVEEYKDGQHGSALATQSDITAAKDSITSTVSKTYATKNDVGVGNLIKNGDFSDGTSNWTTNGGTSKIVDGTYGKQFVFTQTGTTINGSNRIYNPSYNHVNGQAYEVSFYAKADKSSKWHFGPIGSSKAASATLDTTLKQYTIQYQADGTALLSIWTDNPTATIHLERVKLSVASGYYATKTEVKQTSDSLTVTISSAVSKAESAAEAAADAQNTANTANTTANTANSNAQNAQNRVGNLETCIKMTADGVRVGKISNGTFTGYSALVNSAGSFDILDSSTNTLASFNKNGLHINSSSDRGMFVGFDSRTNSGYIGSTPRPSAIGVTGIDIGMNMEFSKGGYLNILNNLGGIGIAGSGVQLTATGGNRVKIGVMDVRGAGVVLFDKDDGYNYASVNIAVGYNFSEFNYIMCFFKTDDGQYFGGTAYHPNGKEYCFTTMGGGAGTTDMSYLKGTRWVFNGTTATRRTTFEIGPGYSTAVRDSVLHIVAIIGFDYYKTSG